MSSFQFAEEDVQVEEVQLRVVFTETGQASRLLRKEDMRDHSLYDKNAAQVGSYIYKELGIKIESGPGTSASGAVGGSGGAELAAVAAPRAWRSHPGCMSTRCRVAQ